MPTPEPEDGQRAERDDDDLGDRERERATGRRARAASRSARIGSTWHASRAICSPVAGVVISSGRRARCSTPPAPCSRGRSGPSRKPGSRSGPRRRAPPPRGHRAPDDERPPAGAAPRAAARRGPPAPSKAPPGHGSHGAHQRVRSGEPSEDEYAGRVEHPLPARAPLDPPTKRAQDVGPTLENGRPRSGDERVGRVEDDPVRTSENRDAVDVPPSGEVGAGLVRRADRRIARHERDRGSERIDRERAAPALRTRSSSRWSANDQAPDDERERHRRGEDERAGERTRAAGRRAMPRTVAATEKRDHRGRVVMARLGHDLRVRRVRWRGPAAARPPRGRERGRTARRAERRDRRRREGASRVKSVDAIAPGSVTAVFNTPSGEPPTEA